MSTVTVVLSREELKRADYLADRACEASPTYQTEALALELDEDVCRNAVEVLARLFLQARKLEQNTCEEGDKAQ